MPVADDTRLAREDPNIVCVFPDADPPTAKIIVLHGVSRSFVLLASALQLRFRTLSTADEANADIG